MRAWIVQPSGTGSRAETYDFPAMASIDDLIEVIDKGGWLQGFTAQRKLVVINPRWVIRIEEVDGRPIRHGRQ